MLCDEREINRITGAILECGFEVHSTLGPGLLESVYRECMAIEMTSAGLFFESEHFVAITYKGNAINTRLRIDLLVERAVVVELKAVDVIHPVHQSQLLPIFEARQLPSWIDVEFQLHSTTQRHQAHHASRSLSTEGGRGEREEYLLAS